MAVELSPEKNTKIQEFFRSLPLENAATDGFRYLLLNRRLQSCAVEANSLTLVWAGECNIYSVTIRHLRKGDGESKNRATFAMHIRSDSATIKVVDDNLKEILTGDRLNPLLYLQGEVAGITVIPGVNINIRDLNIISDIRLSD